MRKGFLIFEEMHIYLVIYEEAVSHILLCNRSLLDFLIYKEIVSLSFSVYCPQSRQSAKPFLQSSELGLSHPFSRRRVCPPTLWSGAGGHTPHSLAGEGLGWGRGGPIPTRGHTLRGALYI
jgi:hypothetical protein